MTTLYRASVGITVWREGHVLVVNNRRWGGYSTPGGKVDHGESLEDAARRELCEETGCRAIGLRMIAGIAHEPVPRDDDRTPWFCTIFVADIGDQEPSEVEPGTKPAWVTPHQLMATSMYPELYRWLFNLLSKLDGTPT